MPQRPMVIPDVVVGAIFEDFDGVAVGTAAAVVDSNLVAVAVLRLIGGDVDIAAVAVVAVAAAAVAAAARAAVGCCECCCYG